MAKKAKRTVPRNDLLPVLLRLRKRGLAYSMPLPSGRLGWRRTAAGTRELEDRDRSHLNDSGGQSKGRTARRRRKRAGRYVGPLGGSPTA